jgi:hypothetical protein
VEEYVRPEWILSVAEGPTEIDAIVTNGTRRVGIHTVDPLQARPDVADLLAAVRGDVDDIAVVTTFDIRKRPFWVANRLPLNR